MKKAVILSVFVVMNLACFPRYEIAQNENGETVRINPITGDVAVLRGDEFVPVKSPEQVQAEAEALAESTDWPHDSASSPLGRFGIEEVHIRTKWIADKMHYRIYVAPWPDAFAEYRRIGGSSPPTLKPSFHDSDSFRRVELEASARGVTRIVDSAGKPVGAQWEGATACTAETYQVITQMEVGWSGFD